MIEFAWDERKARRNEREHHISFAVGQAALESGLGVEIDEQFREGEWRPIIVAPFGGMLLLHITIAFYSRGEDENSASGANEETEQRWTGKDGIIRIISVRKATAYEQSLYFEARPQSMG